MTTPDRRHFMTNRPSSQKLWEKLVQAWMAACALSMVNGCTLGPDFKRPDPPQITQYTGPSDPATTVSVKDERQVFHYGQAVPADWWRLFRNDALDKLIVSAVKGNPSLQAAQAALKQSEFNLKAGNGVFYPEIDLGASFARQKLSPMRQGIAASGSIFSLYTIAASASYVLDVFGAEHRAVEQLSAQTDAQREVFRAAYLSLIGNIVNTAIAQAAYHEETLATERIVDNQRQQLQLLQAQSQSGLIPESTLVTLESQLALTEATLPILRQREDATRHLLANLLGSTPAEATLPTLAWDDFAIPAQIPISLPSELARQRPDIRQAEADLHAASAQIGVATAALFPTFTLSGTYGANNTTLQQLGNRDSQFWSYGPGMTVPLFQGSTAWNRKEAAKSAYEVALANYRSTVLTGVQQVADTLEAVTHDAEMVAARQQVLDMADRQIKLTEANHQAGLVGDMDSLVARQQWESARISVIDAAAQRYQDTVALFMAMGGGWWDQRCPSVTIPEAICDVDKVSAQKNRSPQ
jgi:NodT family efflux transporter outer membrane factor (OMF) lipoprotein